MRALLIITVFSLLPLLPVQAQEAAVTPGECCEEMSDLEYYAWETVSGVLPLLVFLLALFFIIRMSIKRNQPYQQRLIEHTEKLELKYDRIIELLEQVVKKEGP
jgi:hypothetical protein